MQHFLNYNLSTLTHFYLSMLYYSYLQGSMKPVVDCLLALKAQVANEGDNFSVTSTTTRGGSPCESVSSRGLESPQSGEGRMRALQYLKFQRALSSPGMTGIVLSLYVE